MSLDALNHSTIRVLIAHARDVRSEGACARASAPVDYDNTRYLNSLEGMLYLLTGACARASAYLKVSLVLIYYSNVDNNITCGACART